MYLKKNLFSIIILSTLVSSKTFSQEVNKFGAHFELEYSNEFRSSSNMGGLRLFITPLYKIAENTTIGIGTGAKFFKTLEIINDVGYVDYKYKELVSIPLYVNTMYKFKVDKTTPFVECKLGYSLLNRDSSFKSNRLFPEHQGEVDVQGNLKGGIFFSPSIGVLFPTIKRQYFSASLAYCLERFSSKTNFVQVNQVVKSSKSHHLAALRVGYIF